MLHNILPDMEKLESRLRKIVPAGYMLALNIRHLTPDFCSRAIRRIGSQSIPSVAMSCSIQS